jgi:hypothetical protein
MFQFPSDQCFLDGSLASTLNDEQRERLGKDGKAMQTTDQSPILCSSFAIRDPPKCTARSFRTILPILRHICTNTNMTSIKFGPRRHSVQKMAALLHQPEDEVNEALNCKRKHLPSDVNRDDKDDSKTVR